MQNLMADIGFCMLSMCLLLSCTNNWGGGVSGPLCKSDLESIIAILESPCTWDLPVHGGLEGIGLDASGFSIDTENSSNSEHVSVLYTSD